MALTMAEVARDYETDGVPSSGPHKIKKNNLRGWGAWVEGIISAFVNVNGGLIYASKALLDADLAHAANSMAWVLGDATVANNGVYRKIGGSGTGSWTRVSDLPFSFIIASDVGAGTANAIQATTSIPVSGSALVWCNVFEANTSSPVTISFNGGTALTIKTNSGNNVAAGGLVAGMIVLGIVSGSTFRLVSDQASASIVAAAEAAQAGAQTAQTAAEAAAATAVAATANKADRRVTLADMQTVSTSAFTSMIYSNGTWVVRNASDYTAAIAADTQNGMFVQSTFDATKVWMREHTGFIYVGWFGAAPGVSAGTNTARIQVGINVAKALKTTLLFGYGTYATSSALLIADCSDVRIVGMGTGTVISIAHASAHIFAATGTNDINGLTIRDIRLTASVTRTGTNAFINVDPMIRKSYFTNIQADAWNSFMWLKKFETIFINGVAADQMATTPAAAYGIRLGTQAASNQGAAAYIDNCQIRGGTSGSSTEANWSMGLVLHDVEGIAVSNSDFQKFDTNFVGDPQTRLVNLFFSIAYFDVTWYGPCMMFRGTGFKSEVLFKGGWLASAGQASGTPVTGLGAYGLWMKGTGAYGRIQFDTLFYNCSQNGIVVDTNYCDATFSGRVYSNGIGTSDNAFFSNTGAGQAAPRLQNIEFSGNGGTICISYGTNSTGYVVDAIVDQQVNLNGTPKSVEIVGATNGRSIASAATLAVPQFGNVWAVTSTGTTFTSIAASWIDREITLVFQSARTAVTGGNISIAGGTFTTAVGSTLTLKYDGSTWYEVGRKA